jgi:DMSO reductase anchor subunit
VSIPGFPDSSITHPNIRFQQTRSMPEEVTRTDSMQVKYHRDAEGNYKPRVDQKEGKQQFWNIKRLSSRENPLVMFTLMTQMAIGAFALVFAGSLLGIESLSALRDSPAYAFLCIASFGLVSLGMFMSTTHLGKPMRFYRGFNNLRYSPVCREGLGIAIFIGMLGLHLLFSLPANSIFQGLWQWAFGAEVTNLIAPATAGFVANILGVIALAGAAGGLYYMVKCYRIRARPFWNHWQVATDFGGHALALGSALAGSAALVMQLTAGVDFTALMVLAAAGIVLGQALYGLGLRAHAKAMNGQEHEGAVSHYIQTTTFGFTYLARNCAVALNILVGLGVILTNGSGVIGIALWSVLMLSLLLTSTVGRALFYVLVIPTTMPGAFFWKNKGFEQHARDIGLASLPQVGVVAHAH